MAIKLETRDTPCELRAEAGNEFAISGLAAKYNTPTKIGGMFIEKIAPGAFARSLRSKADVKATFNHSLDHILGRTKSGTLTLKDSAEGLRFHCQLDRKSQAHRDLYSSVKRGDIDSCSFAFFVPDGGDKWDGNKRTLLDVDLKDVSIVTSPAYPGTSVNARSESEEDTLECECDCPECMEGNCDACTHEDCECEGCTDCGQRAEEESTPTRSALRTKLNKVSL